MSSTPAKSDAPMSDSARCSIVEDTPEVARFIARALSGFGVDSEHFLGVPGLVAALRRHIPDLVFLDISLSESDAIEAIHALAAVRFSGAVQLMSGSNAGLLEDVRQVGERRGLRMRPTLAKPFRLEAVKTVVDEENLGSVVVKRSAASPDAPSEDRALTAPSINLREALDRNWVELWYQPKFDLAQGRIDGAEGLARVRHPELGLLSPASFIPNASDVDLISLAERALHMSLRDAADLAFVGHPLRLAINVPVDALLKQPIPAIVREGRPRGDGWLGIILEVTEDQIIRDIATAHEIATQLRIYQVSLAIDDFGKGYSSLARLRELPFGELKLDQSFVQNSGADATNATLCKLVIDLAHRFGAVAVAEGIETTIDLDAIQCLGCDLGQGFLLARPMPKELFMSRLMVGEAGFAKEARV